MNDYSTFLESKAIVIHNEGVSVDPADLHPTLFAFQRDMVRWAAAKGRAAIFADCGLGKTFMQIEWARMTGERALILAPLSVAQQTVGEGRKLGVEIAYCREQSSVAHPITITNYEMLDKFDPARFGAVVLDESSILKAFEGKTRARLIAAFAQTPYRLCCTATPAPNDIAEIANHAEFLGIMTRTEMLATFFVHDDEGWRLKGHAREAFYRWLASWSMALQKPSDLGYSDEGFALPPLSIEPVIIPSQYAPANQLFFTALKGIGDRSKVRRATIDERVARTAALVQAEPDRQWIVWAGLNDEQNALARILGAECVSIQGSTPLDQKVSGIERFLAGDVRVLLSKVSVAGFGLNLQCASRMAFVGLGDSYEQYYQAIRRSWRFGQRQPVTAYIVLSDAEEAIYHNVLRKEQDARVIATELIANVREFEKAEIGRGAVSTEPTGGIMVAPSWLTAEVRSPIHAV